MHSRERHPLGTFVDLDESARPTSFSVRFAALGSLILALTFTSCDGSSPSSEDHSTKNSSSSLDGSSTLRFTDVSESSGILLENVSGSREKRAIPETLGQGACAIDYDRDGWIDIYVVNGSTFDNDSKNSPTSALYRNMGGFKFEDRTKDLGLNSVAWGHGATAVDFDGDGWQDLYVTVYLGPNRFYKNHEGKRFELNESWGGDCEGPSTVPVFFDADQDGDLDLYVGNYVDYDPKNPPNQGHPCEWRGLEVLCGPRGTTPVSDIFYENREGVLKDATESFGFSTPRPSYTLGAISCDIDDDGDMDLYVANDSRANYFFLNEGQGKFREAGLELGVDRNEDARTEAGMGVDAGDVDNDGRLDLFVTNFSHETNTLYRNLTTSIGETLFQDATYNMNLARDSFSSLSWGTRIIDLDLDGWQDIIVACGHVYPQVDGAETGTTYAQQNQVYRSKGVHGDQRLTFQLFSPKPDDAFTKKAVSRGLLTADLDDDGDPDILSIEMEGLPTLIRNDTEVKGHWIGFMLTGTGKNLDAIGAKIEAVDSLGIKRWRDRSSGGSYLSSHDPRLVFGLGNAGGPVRSIEVTWPDGTHSTYKDLDIGCYWSLNIAHDNAKRIEGP